MKESGFGKMLYVLQSATEISEIEQIKNELAEYMPAIKNMFGFDQENSAHQYDLWEHSVRTVLNLPRCLEDDMLYLAALLHDIGKPASQCQGKRINDTNKHYYGHPHKSMQIVRDEIIPEMMEKGVCLSVEEQKRVLYYVEYHDDRVSLRIKHLKRHLRIASLEEFQKLMLLQVADAKAHVLLPIIEERIRICEKWTGEYAYELCEKFGLHEGM